MDLSTASGPHSRVLDEGGDDAWALFRHRYLSIRHLLNEHAKRDLPLAAILAEPVDHLLRTLPLVGLWLPPSVDDVDLSPPSISEIQSMGMPQVARHLSRISRSESVCKGAIEASLIAGTLMHLACRAIQLERNNRALLTEEPISEATHQSWSISLWSPAGCREIPSSRTVDDALYFALAHLPLAAATLTAPNHTEATLCATAGRLTGEKITASAKGTSWILETWEQHEHYRVYPTCTDQLFAARDFIRQAFYKNALRDQLIIVSDNAARDRPVVEWAVQRHASTAEQLSWMLENGYRGQSPRCIPCAPAWEEE
jgi:hypothetical protein